MTNVFKIKDTITARKKSEPKTIKKLKIPKKVAIAIAQQRNLLSAGVETKNSVTKAQLNSFFDVLFSAHKDILKLFDFENVIGYKASAGLLTLNLVDKMKIEISPLAFVDTKDNKGKIISSRPRYEYAIYQNKKLLQRIADH